MATESKSAHAFQNHHADGTTVGALKLRVAVILLILLVLFVPPVLWTLAKTGSLHTSTTIAQKDLKWEDGLLRSAKRAFSPPLNDLDERYAKVFSHGRPLSRKRSIRDLQLPEVKGAFWIRGNYIRIKPFAEAPSDRSSDERYTIQRPLRIGPVIIAAWPTVSFLLIALLWKKRLLRPLFCDCRRVWAGIVKIGFQEVTSNAYPLIYAIIATTALAVVHLEKLRAPYLVAEDGPIFLQQNLGFGAAAIFTPYAGYLLLLPRIIAFLSGFGAIDEQARIHVLGCLVVMWGVFLLLAKYTANILESVVLAVFLIVAPFNGYLMLSLTNLQWFIGLVLVLLAAKPLPGSSSRWEKGFVAILALLIALTGPFSIITLPVFLLQAWWQRSRFAILMAALQSAAVLIQAVCMFTYHRPPADVSNFQDRANPAEWLAGYMLGLFGYLPDDFSAGSTVVGLTLAGAFALAIVVAWRYWKGTTENRIRLTLLLGMAAVFAAAGWVRAGGRGVPWLDGERYYVIPYALCLMVITSMFFARFRGMKIAAGGVLVALFIGLSTLPVHTISSVEWEPAVNQIPPGGHGFIETYPPGDKWAVFVAKNQAGEALKGQAYRTMLLGIKPRAFQH